MEILPSQLELDWAVRISSKAREVNGKTAVTPVGFGAGPEAGEGKNTKSNVQLLMILG